MRLTLRTLLAYLEDELKPSESKEIGQKIAASPVATSLAQRIREVMRRRRLSMEDLNESGLDANLVAEYLDGSLSAQEVADVEKVCLGSDAHLAEVAACHQILTLVLGEPVEISEASRERMYALSDDGTAAKFDGSYAPSPLTVSSVPEPTPFPEHLMRKPWWKRAFPLLVPGVLIGLWVIIIVFFVPSLNPFVTSGNQGNGKIQITAIEDDVANDIAGVEQHQNQKPDINSLPENSEKPGTNIDPEPPPDMPEPGENTTPQVVVADSGDETPDANSTKPSEVTPPDPGAEKPSTVENGAESETPAEKLKVVGRYQSSEGVMLAYDPAQSGWYSIPYELQLLERSELIVPVPFSGLIKMEDNAPLVVLEGGTRVELITDSPAASIGLDLKAGRVMLESTNADGTPFAIRAGELDWRIELIGANSRVGVELVPLSVYGFEQPLPKNYYNLRLLVSRGGARVANAQGQSVMVDENQQIVLHNPMASPAVPEDPTSPPNPQLEPGQLSETLLQPTRLLPDWLQLSRPAPSPIQNKYREDYASQFDPVLGASENMEPLLNDNRPKMAEYAVSCLGLIGDYRNLIATLQVSDYEETRVSALNSLRLWLPRNLESREQYLNHLALAFPNNEDASLIDRLLWGFTQDEARDSQISQDLVSWLEHSQPVIRELAFLEVARLTGFDSGYRALVTPSQRRLTVQRWQRMVRDEGSLLPSEDVAPLE